MKNTQTNRILVRDHQVLGGMLRRKNIQDHEFDDIGPWSFQLAAVHWTVCSTQHITLNATPKQLILD